VRSAPENTGEGRMSGYVEITNCTAGFRVRKVDAHCATFGHDDFRALADAERFARSLVIQEPTLGVVNRMRVSKRARDSARLASAA
jgi:hypothetical protein